MSLRGPIARNRNSNNEILLHRLQRNEERFTDLIDDLENAHQGNSNLRNRDVRQLIRGAFDGMRDATLDVFDSFGSNSEEDEVQEQSSFLDAGDDDDLHLPVTANSSNSDYSVHPHNRNDVLAQVQPYEIGRRNNTDTRSRSHDSWSSMPDQLSGLSISEPVIQHRVQPIPATTHTEHPAIAAADVAVAVAQVDAGVCGWILGMLRRMAQRLVGFFRWLWTKIKELAARAWNAVCNAFSSMFSYLSNLFWGVQASDNDEAGSQQLLLENEGQDLPHAVLSSFQRSGSSLVQRHVLGSTFYH